MKNIKRIIAHIIISFFIVACNKDTFNDIENSYHYHAALETFDTDTKTALVNESNIVWSEGDMIAVFEGNREGEGQAYKIVDQFMGSSSGEFSVVEGLTTNYFNFYEDYEVFNGTIAIYPFNAKISNSYNRNIIDFPSEQRYIAGSFSDEVFPMIACCKDDNRLLSFKNLLGVLKLSFTGSFQINSITLTGNSEERLSGMAYINIDSEGIPSVEMLGSASDNITLTCDPAVQLDSDKATDFYICIPPTDFSKGFTITITDVEGKEIIKTTSKVNNIRRSHILEMPALNLKEIEQWEDLGLSVKWAAWNVGANTPEEYGGLYAWGETLEKTEYNIDSYTHVVREYYGTGENDWYLSPTFIGEEISGTEYDVAHVLWGDGARLPTLDEIQELVNKCTFKKGSFKGTEGVYVIGPNNNNVFFPCFREGDDSRWYDYYWSGTYCEVGDIWGYPDSAHSLALDQRDGITIDRHGGCRFEGLRVRPVKN